MPTSKSNNLSTSLRNDLNVTAVTSKELTLCDSRRNEHHPGIGGVLLAFVAGLAHPSNLSMAALRQLLLEPGLTTAETKTAKTRTKQWFNHSSSHGVRREAGPLGVPWPGGMQVSRVYWLKA